MTIHLNVCYGLGEYFQRIICKGLVIRVWGVAVGLYQVGHGGGLLGLCGCSPQQGFLDPDLSPYLSWLKMRMITLICIHTSMCCRHHRLRPMSSPEHVLDLHNHEPKPASPYLFIYFCSGDRISPLWSPGWCQSGNPPASASQMSVFTAWAPMTAL